MRSKVDEINIELLSLINARAKLIEEIGNIKTKQGLPRFDPVREREMINNVVNLNKGPFDDKTIRYLYKQIFKASLELQQENNNRKLLVSREKKQEDTIVKIGNIQVGKDPMIIAGPCSVESEEQVEIVANELVKQGIQLIRGGAFKPRTSPYDFQGLGIDGLKILRKVADKYGLKVVSEIVSPMDIEMSTEYVDVIQIELEICKISNYLKLQERLKFLFY